MLCSYPYTVKNKADGKIEISFSQFPDCSTTLSPGADNQTIRKTASNLLLNIFEDRMVLREMIPGGEESECKAESSFIFVSWLTLAKLILHNEFCKADATYNTFAKKANTTPTRLGRILNLRHNSKETVMFSAFHALGIEMDWDVNIVPNN